MAKKLTPPTSKKADLADLLASEPEHEQNWHEPAIHNHYYQPNKKRLNFGQLAFGLTMIMLGFIYLAVNMGWLPPEAQPDLWKLWPLLLVFFGLSMVAGHGLISILAGIVLTMTVLAVAGIIVFGTIPVKVVTEPKNFTISMPTETTTPVAFARDPNATSVGAIIAVTASQLTLSGGNSQLISGDFQTNAGQMINNTATVGTSQMININVSQNKNSAISNIYSRLNLGVSPDLGSLEIRSALSQLYLDESALPVASSTIKIDQGSVNLNLANGSAVKEISIQGEGCKINFNLPTGHALKLESQTPVDLADFSLQTDGSYQSVGYASAPFKTNIKLGTTNCSLKVVPSQP